jgi:biopolymer transport protein ExbB/biopolymer transport protein TolQ
MAHVMVGIAEALIATAVGLFVALPAVIAYNVMAKKVSDVENNVAILGKQLLAFMKSTTRIPAGVTTPVRRSDATELKGVPATAKHGLAVADLD